MAVLPWIRSSRRTGDGELRLQVLGRNTRNSSVTFLDVATRSVLLIVAVTFPCLIFCAGGVVSADQK
jgi:hypothetical protein